MSDDMPVFRSEAPHQVAVPQAGGDAVSPPIQHPDGETRQIVDRAVFAPLDEPRSVSELELTEDALPPELNDQVEASVEGGVGPEPSDSPELAEPGERGARRVSPELMARAAELRIEIDATSDAVDALIESFTDFTLSESESPDARAGQSALPATGAAAKEPA